MDHITYRLATMADLDALVAMRLAFLAEVAPTVQPTPELSSKLREYFLRYMPTGEFVAYIALVSGKVVGTSGMVFHRHPPTPTNLAGLNAYVMNMYTMPAWRQHRVATTLLQLLLSDASAKKCKRVSLHALPSARHLYTNLGFMPTDNEMVLDLGVVRDEEEM